MPSVQPRWNVRPQLAVLQAYPHCGHRLAGDPGALTRRIACRIRDHQPLTYLRHSSTLRTESGTSDRYWSGTWSSICSSSHCHHQLHRPHRHCCDQNRSYLHQNRSYLRSIISCKRRQYQHGMRILLGRMPRACLIHLTSWRKLAPPTIQVQMMVAVSQTVQQLVQRVPPRKSLTRPVKKSRFRLFSKRVATKGRCGAQALQLMVME